MPHAAVSRWTEEASMRTARRWTSADPAVLPDDGKRYEIIDGDLYMSRLPPLCLKEVPQAAVRAVVLHEQFRLTTVREVG